MPPEKKKSAPRRDVARSGVAIKPVLFPPVAPGGVWSSAAPFRAVLQPPIPSFWCPPSSVDWPYLGFCSSASAAHFEAPRNRTAPECLMRPSAAVALAA